MIVQVLASILLTVALQSAAPAAQRSQPAPQETPRALIERAAYKAEHERDLDGAIALYAEAAKLARASGDLEAARLAELQRQTLLFRLGKAEAPAQQHDEADLAARAASLVAAAAVKPTFDDYKAMLDDIALFGTLVVPWLERLLVESGPVDFADYRVAGNPQFAAYALARIDAPAAVTALSRGLDSKDPLVRRAVLNALHRDRHRDILVRAVRDPVEQVRTSAVARLSAAQDPELYPLFEELARGGNATGLEWCVRYAYGRLVARLPSPEFDDAFRRRALDALSTAALNDLTVETVERAVQLARSTESSEVRAAAERASARMFQVGTESKALAPQLEELALREITARPSAAALEWMKRPTHRTLRAMPDIAVKVAASGDPALLGAFASLVSGVSAESAPERERFDAWLALFESLPPSVANHVVPGRSQASTVREWCAAVLATYAEREPTMPALEAVIAAFAGLDAERRTSFVPVLRARIQAEASRAQRTGTELTFPASIGPALRAMLADSDERTRVTAMTALEHVPDAALIDLALDGLADRTTRGRAPSAGYALVRIDPERAARTILLRVLPVLSKPALDDGERELVDAIGWLPDDRALVAWREAWTAAKSEAARGALLRVLTVEVNGAEATAELLARFPDVPSSERWARTRAIERFGRELHDPAIPLLGEALRDSDENVRKAAREASQKFKEQREALEEFAAWTKASAEARQSIADLVALLESPNRDVAIGAARALAALKAKSALPALVKLLARDDPALKAAVQDAIARIGE